MEHIQTFESFIVEYTDGFKEKEKKAGKDIVYVNKSLNESSSDSFDVSGISRNDLNQILNYLDSNDISYDFDGRNEILDFDITELDKKTQDKFTKMGLHA